MIHQNETYLIYHLSNPSLMDQLTKGTYLPIGDGLEMKMNISTHGPYLEFEFRLEGRDIGSIDHEHGGYIHQDYHLNSHKPLENDDDFILMCKVCDRMEELFPNIRNLMGI